VSRWRLVAVVVLVALGVIGWFVAQKGAPPDPGGCAITGCGPQQPTPAVVTADDLARRYAPILYLRNPSAPCADDGDPFDPVPVDVVLENSEIIVRKGRQQVGAGPTASQLFRGPPDMQLDYPGHPRDPGCRYYSDGARFSAGKPRTAYVRIVLDEDEGMLAVQFWLYYYFNPWNNRHEGDWEMVQVVFEAETLHQAYETGPAELGYSQHSGGESAKWGDSKVRSIGDHPVVYVAQGSHANFYNPAVYLGRGEQRTGVGCEEARGPHRRVDVEPVLLPDAVLEPSNPFAWITYQGTWGEQAGGQDNGPTGPNMKRAWRSPFEWQSSLRSGSVRVPDTLVGPNATSALCDIIVFASQNLLAGFEFVPWIIGGAMLGLLAAALAALRRTSYRPVELDPLGLPRRLGQILAAAFTIQVRRWRTFVAIGLLFIPFAFITSGFEWVLLRFSPVGALTSFGTESAGQRILVILALGQAQMSIGYLLVTMLAIAVIALRRRNQPSGLGDATRLTFGHLSELLAARLLALFVTLALAISVIGLPFAFIWTVRWAYLEQAILLDGLSFREAFKASSSAAQTEWWWSFATTLGLSAFGLALAPATGIVLLIVFRSLDLTYVNIITSAVYVAVTPYVAIALTLVYMNLKTALSNREIAARRPG
jgi:hypothetical protein